MTLTATEAPEARKTGLKFSAVGSDIKQGDLTIARATSTNFAKRIANALNVYIPDKRGQ